jgi:hypothetical protein
MVEEIQGRIGLCRHLSIPDGILHDGIVHYLGL